VLQRPGGCALGMRCCDLSTTRCDQPADGSPPIPTVTVSWHAI
jgi:hypothetical protein